MANYFTIITDIGRKKIAEAARDKKTVDIRKIAFGDGNGQPIVPKPEDTALHREVYRTDISTIKTNPKQPHQLSITGVIPKDSGGYYVREVGIFDIDNEMIAIGNVPEQYKPKPDEGSAGDYVVQIIISNENVNVIKLIIEPSTLAWVPKQESGFYYPFVSYLKNAIVTNPVTGFQYQSLAENNLNHPLTDKSWWKLHSNNESEFFYVEFTNSNLKNGIFTFTHGLNKQRGLFPALYNDKNELCCPDIVFPDNTPGKGTIDFSNIGPLEGTYKLKIYSTVRLESSEPEPKILIHEQAYKISDFVEGFLKVPHNFGSKKNIFIATTDQTDKKIDPDPRYVSDNYLMLDFGNMGNVKSGKIIAVCFKY